MESRQTVTEPSAAATAGQIAIDPALLEQFQASGADLVAEVAGLKDEGEEDEGEENEGDENEGEGNEGNRNNPDAVQQARSKRLTAREKATKYGIVDGVMRGNTVHSMFWTLHTNECEVLTLDRDSAAK